MKRILVIALPVLVALGAGLMLANHLAHHTPGDGVIRLSSLPADVFYLDASKIARRGPGGVLVVRLDSPVEFIPHHFKSEGLEEPLTADGWARHLGAPMVFNAGQYDENMEYLGWLKASGKWLKSRKKNQWMGLLLSGPHDQNVWARIGDLETMDEKIVERYEHALQSMMLLDHTKKVRVRDTDNAASRSVIAEDTQGRLIFIQTQGAVTLADLARWLLTTDLNIVRAMNLDGGIESQIALQTPEFQLSMYGHYGTNNSTIPGTQGFVRYPIPVIVEVRPIKLSK